MELLVPWKYWHSLTWRSQHDVETSFEPRRQPDLADVSFLVDEPQLESETALNLRCFVILC